MPTKLELVLFDADGVLIDSKAPHLRFCRDKSDQYQLGLKIPAPDEFPTWVQVNRAVSPMSKFIELLGFPRTLVPEIIQDYDANFQANYPCQTFPGVKKMLSHLHDFKRLQLGLITSNVRANIQEPLGNSMTLFNPEATFTKDQGLGKTQAIQQSLKALNLEPQQARYVGDMSSDITAARQAEVPFIGATYCSWEITPSYLGSHGIQTAQSVDELTEILSGRNSL